MIIWVIFRFLMSEHGLRHQRHPLRDLTGRVRAFEVGSGAGFLGKFVVRMPPQASSSLPP